MTTAPVVPSTATSGVGGLSGSAGRAAAAADRRRMMSNAEVHAFLREKKEEDQRTWHGAEFQQLLTVQFEALRYLARTPAAYQDAETLAAFNAAVAPFGLTRAERLMLLNLRPASAVELFSIVEEIGERLSEEQQEQLLEIVQSTLPFPSE
ncbi:hypothetical protein HK405_000315 [Cladochytrium tenue]|nr:hypothetical protein HK405_000315 [Cladochytrium tenue]